MTLSASPAAESEWPLLSGTWVLDSSLLSFCSRVPFSSPMPFCWFKSFLVSSSTVAVFLSPVLGTALAADVLLAGAFVVAGLLELAVGLLAAVLAAVAASLLAPDNCWLALFLLTFVSRMPGRIPLLFAALVVSAGFLGKVLPTLPATVAVLVTGADGAFLTAAAADVALDTTDAGTALELVGLGAALVGRGLRGADFLSPRTSEDSVFAVVWVVDFALSVAEEEPTVCAFCVIESFSAGCLCDDDGFVVAESGLRVAGRVVVVEVLPAFASGLLDDVVSLFAANKGLAVLGASGFEGFVPRDCLLTGGFCTPTLVGASLFVADAVFGDRDFSILSDGSLDLRLLDDVLVVLEELCADGDCFVIPPVECLVAAAAAFCLEAS